MSQNTLSGPFLLTISAGSSEALLKGQKPPLILAAQLLDGNGQRVGIPALSEGFVVGSGDTEEGTH